MRCAYYCCGEGYDLQKISDYFTSNKAEVMVFEPEVMMVKIGANKKNEFVHICIFSYGCICFWGLEKEKEEEILESISAFLIEPLDKPIKDSCKYQEGASETDIDEEADIISIEGDDPYIKLSMAYGLSQSVKLVEFENSVDHTIDKNKHIPQDIIKKGKIQYPRKILAVKIGELLEERNKINLHSTILDTPEFFWRRPKYEPYYEMAVNFMDLEFRLNILNKRLEVLHDLYGVLSDELQHVHTSRLEVIIILLILIEVIVVLLKEVIGFL